MSIKKLLSAILFLSATYANAGVINGGSTLLDVNGLAQLEAWKGSGSLVLTNIFTKQQGSTSSDFHAAADNKGATFVLMSVSYDNTNWKTIGGYDPLSWTSNDNFNRDIAGNAFIFNLTDSQVYHQDGIDPDYQTYNSINYGPTFGVGHDIWTDNNLSIGYSYNYSYSTNTGFSIVDTSGWYGGANFRIAALEVFTFAPDTGSNDVPEPSSIGLLGLGVLAFLGARRRSK